MVESAVAFALPTIQGATQAELQAAASPIFHGVHGLCRGTGGKMVKTHGKSKDVGELEMLFF